MIHTHEASYINGIVSDWTEFYYKITHGHLLDVNKTRKTCFIKDLRAAEISSWLSPGPVYPDKSMYDQTITSSAHWVDVAACVIFSWFHLYNNNKRHLRLGLIIIRLTVLSLLCGRVPWRRASDCMFKEITWTPKPRSWEREREREVERERCMFDDRIMPTGKVILIACQVHTNLSFAVIIP